MPTVSNPVLVNPRSIEGSVFQRIGTILVSVVLYQLVRYIWPTVSPTAASACAAMAAILWLVASTPPNMNLLPAEDKPILITGCDTGFGHWLAWRLDQLGCVVFASCLNGKGPGACKLRDTCSDRLQLIQMDITKDEQINQALEQVKDTLREKNLPPLWGLVNNACVNCRGDLEITSMEWARHTINVNQIGPMMVTKAFLPMIRQRKGRVVNFSSVQGRHATCLNSTYACTKYAIDAYSVILRQEMMRFGVKVVIIEPSNFGGITEGLNSEQIEKMLDNFWENMSDELRETYGRDYVYAFLESAHAVAPTTSRQVYRVLDAAIQGVLGVRPNTRYLVKGGCQWLDWYKIRAVIYPFIPDSWMDKHVLGDLRTFPLPAVLRQS